LDFHIGVRNKYDFSLPHVGQKSLQGLAFICSVKHVLHKSEQGSGAAKEIKIYNILQVETALLQW